MDEYAQVVVKGKKMSYYVRILRDTDTILSGIEVDIEGEDIISRDLMQRVYVIEKVKIKKYVPMVIGVKSGVLEPAE